MTRQTAEPSGDLTGRIIRLGIKVHRALGPGLLESIYLRCLRWELENDGLRFQREVPLPVIYQDLRLDRAYLADLIVENEVLVEVKAVEHILPLHEAQTRTYLRLSTCAIGLLMNFNTLLLKDGLRRYLP